MQELTRPVHLPGVFEELLEAIGQRKQPASLTPAQWRNWDLTHELPLQVPAQWHSRRAPAGTALWSGCNAEATGTHQTSEKEVLGTDLIPGRDVFSVLRCWKRCSCAAFWRVQERSTEGVILMGEFFPTCPPLFECQEGGGKAL